MTNIGDGDRLADNVSGSRWRAERMVGSCRRLAPGVIDTAFGDGGFLNNGGQQWYIVHPRMPSFRAMESEPQIPANPDQPDDGQAETRGRRRGIYLLPNLLTTGAMFA